MGGACAGAPADCSFRLPPGPGHRGAQEAWLLLGARGVSNARALVGFAVLHVEPYVYSPPEKVKAFGCCQNPAESFWL